MKKLIILLVIMAFGMSAYSQSISLNVNSIDLKYGGIDASNWCPPGSTIDASLLTRSITISKDNVQLFTYKLTNVKKVDNAIQLSGIASDKNNKNVKIFASLYYSGKVKVKIVTNDGKVYKRVISLL